MMRTRYWRLGLWGMILFLQIVPFRLYADTRLEALQPTLHHTPPTLAIDGKKSPHDDPWQYQYRHITAPQWPYANEYKHELLVTLPTLCFDRVARVLRTPAVHALLNTVTSTPILSRNLHATRHSSLRVRVKPMIQSQGMMFVLEHRSFSARRDPSIERPKTVQ
ncbi:MAG: hypothetical protein V4490_08435 [Pseudomonadota bacterium]